MKKPGEDIRILNELKKAGTMGLPPYYFPNQMGILQYGRAINKIRKDLGCECKNGVHCYANEHVINRTTPDGYTKFFYENTTPDFEKYRQEMIAKRDEVQVQPQGALF